MINQKFSAIFDEDLINVLKKAGELQKIEEGKVFCSICSSLITLKNIQIIIPSPNNEFIYVCNDTVCVENFYNNLRKK
jgi:hypothetical protein